MDTRVKNESMESVGSNKHLTVGGEKDGQTWGDYRELVYGKVSLQNKKDLHQSVGSNMRLTIGAEKGGGDFGLKVKGNRMTYVNDDDHVSVFGTRTEAVGKDQKLTVLGDQQESVTMNHALDAGMAIHLKAGTTCVIEAGAQLSLKVGGNFIDISAAGVAISGTMVMINSGGAPGSGAGSSTKAPDEAPKAEPDNPTPADDAKTGYKSS
jgi:type VI secretion system secreted protein VgrG